MKLTVILIVLALGLFPAAAWANVGIGYLFVSAPALLFALVPAIFVEAPVLAAILRVAFPRGLMLSVGANLRSTFFGIGIALVTDFLLMFLSGGSGLPPSRGSLMVSLVPMYFLTWWIEHRAIARKLPEAPRRQIVLATFAANTLSYVLLMVAIGWTPMFKTYDQMGYRDRLYWAVRAAVPLQSKVEEYWDQHKRLPERAADIGPASTEPRRDVGTVTLDAGGKIFVELKFPDDPDLDRKQFILAPHVTEDKKIEWRCSAPGVPERFLPRACQQ